MKLRMYIEVIASRTTAYGGQTLWFKDIVTNCVPTLDDEVHLFYDREDNEDWCLQPVKRRYMDTGGDWTIELADMMVDPGEYDQNQMKNDLASGRLNRSRSWWTSSNDGVDPEIHLIENGWKKYLDERNSKA